MANSVKRKSRKYPILAARDQYFLTISPSGQAIYHSGETYSFVGLKRNFGTQTVMHVLDPSYPSVFFADR